MAEEYAKYSVVVRPVESSNEVSPRKGDTSSVENDSGADTPAGQVVSPGVASAGCPEKANVPKFHIKPVTSYGDGIIGQEGNQLSDEGPELLDLAGKYFSIDWRNHPRAPEYVVVEEKDLISIKYDPFMNLSVPLPKQQKLLPVIIFFKDWGRVPLKIAVKVTQDASVEQLTAAVERVTAIQPEHMRVYEIFRGKFHRMFKRGCSLSSVVSSDTIVVYEVLSEEEAGEEVYEVPIIQRTVCPRVTLSHCASCYKRPGPGEVLRRCTQCWGIGYCNQDCQKDHWLTHKRSCKRVPQPIGTPFIVSIPASQATFSQLQTMAEEYAKYSVFVRPGESSKKDSPWTGDTSSVEND